MASIGSWRQLRLSVKLLLIYGTEYWRYYACEATIAAGAEHVQTSRWLILGRTDKGHLMSWKRSLLTAALSIPAIREAAARDLAVSLRVIADVGAPLNQDSSGHELIRRNPLLR